jgi:hypothetical protein
MPCVYTPFLTTRRGVYAMCVHALPHDEEGSSAQRLIFARHCARYTHWHVHKILPVCVGAFLIAPHRGYL